MENVRVNRMPLHIYDMEKLMDTDFSRDALNSPELYHTIVEHRKMLTAMMEVDYSTHVLEKINSVPPVGHY